MREKALCMTGLLVFATSLLLEMSCAVPPSRPSTEPEIRVGAIVSLTGVNAIAGAEHQWAYQRAVADINSNGGVYVKELGRRVPLKLIFADDQSHPDGGASAMERLITIDHVGLALSSNGTFINIAAAAVCENHNVYFQTIVTWLEFIQNQHFKWVSGMFSSWLEVGRTPFLVWESLPKEQRPKRPALLMEDNPDGRGFGNTFKRFAREYGYVFAVDEYFTPGTKSLLPQIMKMKAEKTDGLLWFGDLTEGITLIRQMKNQDLRLPYIHGWKGFSLREFQQILGKDTNYIVHDGFWSDKFGAPGAKELQGRFVKEFGRDSVTVGLSYANPQILAMAIEKAGSLNSKKVRDAVFGGKFKGTMMGDVRYNKKGLSFMTPIALQWWNGERMPVYPPVPDLWMLKLPPQQMQ
jgi:branched-chain amino acid transport system substrate-binding protein